MVLSPQEFLRYFFKKEIFHAFKTVHYRPLTKGAQSLTEGDMSFHFAIPYLDDCFLIDVVGGDIYSNDIFIGHSEASTKETVMEDVLSFLEMHYEIN